MERVLSREKYKMKGPGQIVIGDPGYLEAIEEGTASKGMKSLVLDANISKNKKCSLIFEEIEDDDEQFPEYGPYKSYVAKICFSSNNEMLKAYENDKYYPSHVKIKKELGCDGACFDIYVGNDKYEHFDTGADGYYGRAVIHKSTFGGIIELIFDEEMFEKESLKQSLMYLFDIKEKDLVYSDNTENLENEVEKE